MVDLVFVCISLTMHASGKGQYSVSTLVLINVPKRTKQMLQILVKKNCPMKTVALYHVLNLYCAFTQMLHCFMHSV